MTTLLLLAFTLFMSSVLCMADEFENVPMQSQITVHYNHVVNNSPRDDAYSSKRARIEEDMSSDNASCKDISPKAEEEYLVVFGDQLQAPPAFKSHEDAILFENYMKTQKDYDSIDYANHCHFPAFTTLSNSRTGKSIKVSDLLASLDLQAAVAEVKKLLGREPSSESAAVTASHRMAAKGRSPALDPESSNNLILEASGK